MCLILDVRLKYGSCTRFFGPGHGFYLSLFFFHSAPVDGEKKDCVDFRHRDDVVSIFS